jgi:hypothetical protein
MIVILVILVIFRSVTSDVANLEVSSFQQVTGQEWPVTPSIRIASNCQFST